MPEPQKMELKQDGIKSQKFKDDPGLGDYFQELKRVIHTSSSHPVTRYIVIHISVTTASVQASCPATLHVTQSPLSYIL